MISCRTVRRHVDAHVDGELDTRSQVEFDAHLASCPHCRDEAAWTRAIKAETRAALGGVRAPEELRRRLLAALESASASSDRGAEDESLSRGEPRRSANDGLDESIAGKRPARRVGRSAATVARYAVPAAAAAVVLGTFATHERQDAPADVLALGSDVGPVFEDVVRRHASEHPAEVRGDERAVSGWFRGKLDFHARPVVFGDDADAELVGGRLSSVRGRDAAAFYYDVHGRRVTVMVFEPPQNYATGAERVRVDGRDVYVRRVRGYTVPVVERDGLTYALTGDLDDQSLLHLAASATPAW